MGRCPDDASRLARPRIQGTSRAGDPGAHGEGGAVRAGRGRAGLSRPQGRVRLVHEPLRQVQIRVHLPGEPGYAGRGGL